MRAALPLLLALALLAACREGTPRFGLTGVDGGRFYLADGPGPATVLVFWFTRCGACKETLADLEKAWRQRRDRGFRFASLCTDPENRDRIRRIARSIGLTHPILLDRGGATARRYDVTEYPTTILLDRNLEILGRTIGWSPARRRRLLQRVDVLLADRSGRP